MVTLVVFSEALQSDGSNFMGQRVSVVLSAPQDDESISPPSLRWLDRTMMYVANQHNTTTHCPTSSEKSELTRGLLSTMFMTTSDSADDRVTQLISTVDDVLVTCIVFNGDDVPTTHDVIKDSSKYGINCCIYG
jgi:hypothetical protein